MESLMFHVLCVENNYTQGRVVNLKRRPMLNLYPVTYLNCVMWLYALIALVL